ncbi:MAG: hypothetical protein WC829_03300 [Hyphomicrobium sp.]|jgi:hypothetical protein
MASIILSTILTSRTHELLEAKAKAAGITVEAHAAQVLADHVARPEWHQVADAMERQALAAEVERVSGERDRARSTALRLWGELEQGLSIDVGVLHPELGKLLSLTADALQVALDVIRTETPAASPRAHLALVEGAEDA